MLKRVWFFLLDAVRTFLNGSCSLHAAGLTYYSLLAFIPILCLILTLAKALDADDCARRFVNTRLDAFITQVETGGEMPPFLQMPGLTEAKKAARRTAAEDVARQARTLANSLFDRIDTFNVRTLGWIGFLGLLWTAVSMLGTMEDALNGIWHVSRPRTLWKRLWLYALAVTVLPLFTIVALSLPVTRLVLPLLGNTLGRHAQALLASPLLGALTSFVFAATAFALVLGCLPHTRVNRRAALEGGAATALMMALWLKVCAVAQVGIAGASALYGSFAVLPIFLAWLYVSWRIFLFGGILTHAFHTLHTASPRLQP